MTRKNVWHLWCAACGKGMHLNPRSSRPQGEATCRPCRSKGFGPPKPALSPRKRRLSTSKSCAHCGVEFYPHRDDSKHCSLSCSTQARAGSKQCKTCGQEFRTSRHRRTFCSDECRRGPGSGKRANVGKAWKVYFPACDVCGSRFSARSSTHRLCSAQCRIDNTGLRVGDLYGAALELGLTIGQRCHWYTMLVDYLRERDGDHCGICLTVIDFTIKSGPRGSEAGRSIDHIHPRSLGGSNEPDNLRLAHWGCNRRRRAKLDSPSLFELPLSA